jgi:beta-glucosidase
MARMTVEEKVGQTIQADIGSITPADLRRYPLGSILAGGSSGPLGAPDRSAAGPWIETARAFRSAALARGGAAIPIMFGIDAMHGHGNVVGATIFPHNIALGATNDPALVRRIGEATAKEVAATGIDWAFGPTVTVPRDDRWGRTYEGYSEDPAIVRAYAGEMVRGLQGDIARGGVVQAGRVGASAKHFLGDGGTAGGVDQGDTRVPEAELAAIHAAGYVPAIEAGVATIMASFNSWNGSKLHGNASLLTDVLKGRMGFDGFVVGDWNGHAQVKGCTPTDCPQSFNAGVDMYMAPDSWRGLFDSTLAHVKSGTITQARLDDAVRRILRVKYKLGLFDPARPWEGRAIGTSDHRALAREAVAKSLVLLKNNGVLPIKASAHVLVAGAGADDIGQQSGGWTLSWQGTGNSNADFPGGTSIWGGIKAAVESGGGRATLSPDGGFTTKPDVAVVVFGEEPYAEGLGDVQNLEYQAGDKTDLALLKRLKAAGVPVVAVFLSGRPLWVNPEINASDAFVAAWQPGSEGAGVADVIIGDARGRARTDFRGQLSFSWPRTAAQTPLNKGDAAYDPLFAYGYGPTYASGARLGALPEVSGIDPATVVTRRLLKGGRLASQARFGTTGAVTMTPVDADSIQEAGRRFAFTGAGRATLALTNPVDMRFYTNTDLALLIEYRVDTPPAAAIRLGLGGGAIDLAPTLRAAPVGEWRNVKVKLKCFAAAGADVQAVREPFAIEAAGAATVSIKTVELVSENEGAICPAN